MELFEYQDKTSRKTKMCCAVCGFESGLHQVAVEVFSRDDESVQAGLHVTVRSVDVVCDRDMACNPSPDRGAVIITFTCEACPGITKLAIAQHEGIEFVMLTTHKTATADEEAVTEGIEWLAEH